jgi:oligosaccharide repeat unit polymerase
MVTVPMNTLLIIVLLTLLSMPAFIALLFKKRIDFFDPCVLFNFCIFIGYVLPIPSFLEGTDRFSNVWSLRYANFDASYSRALIQTILAVIGFLIGYLLLGKLIPQSVGHMKRGKNYVIVWSCARLQIIGILYSVLGLGMFAIGVAIIGGPAVLLKGLGDRIRLFAGLNYFFSAINLLLIISLVWWTYLLNVRRLGDKLFWIYTLFAIVVASFQGAKSILFVFILCGALIYHLLYRPLKTITIVCAGIGMVIFLSTYAIYVREYLVLSEFATITSLSFDSLLEIAVREFTGDFMQLQALTVVIDNTPRVIPFQYGQTFLAFLTIPIPSSIFPDKYLPSTGIFTIALWPDRWLEGGTTTPPGLIGEMYMNFGPAGVFMGMLIFGSVFGYARAYIYRKNLEPTSVSLYAILVAMIPHYIRGESVAPTVMLAIFALPMFFALRFVIYRKARLAESGAPASQVLVGSQIRGRV